mmetsp:Transcript_18421/g.41760  ORF Transcript_18421/g.41760 Transcript_18421/m.41760 type:complete len:322 (-) Transcript_18421:418-1383(-)
MRVKTWVERGLDERVRLEHLGNLQGILAVPLHPNIERSDPTHQQVAVHRVERGRDKLLDLGQPVEELGGRRRNRPGEDVAVSTEVLRAGLNRNVCAKFQRPRVVRSREGAVTENVGPVGARPTLSVDLVDDSAHALKIRDPASRVRWSLAVHDPCVIPQCLFVVLRTLLPRAIDEVYFDSPVERELLQKLVSSAVDGIREDCVIARLEHGHERGCNRRHARSEEHCSAGVLHSLERGDLLRARLVRRRSPPGVHEAIVVGVRRLFLVVQPGAVVGVVEKVCRAKVYRRRESPVGLLARVVKRRALGRERLGLGVLVEGKLA